jgi:catechol 2,3-dioxygenase-like lactoylglutathione lyase family enzyme
MALHRLTQIVMGVPSVEETAAYYTDFGLMPRSTEEVAVSGAAPAPTGDHTFSTVDGGEQLRIVHSERRRLLQLGVGADDPDDLDRVAASLTALGVTVRRTGTGVRAVDPGTGVTVDVEVAGRYNQKPAPAPAYNTPGVDARTDQRAPGILREQPVRPRKLGHVVLGSTDQELSQQFFQRGIGFKVSDTVPGLAAFMRCSTDHHNVLVQQSPVAFLHHTSWQVDDVDDVGRGASAIAGEGPRPARLGPGPPLRRLELLLVPQGPGRQLLRVLLRPGLHRRRRAVEARRLGGRPQPLQLGPAPAAVIPRPRRPRRADDRRPPGAVTARPAPSCCRTQSTQWGEAASRLARCVR